MILFLACLVLALSSATWVGWVGAIAYERLDLPDDLRTWSQDRLGRGLKLGLWVLGSSVLGLGILFDMAGR